ncbi:DUF342 domain-containing protein [Filobacillus milosensis]|uniref:DUF342 domain-containing protein n=1 Tax=Filobacillus milosensis TaxID=94137 RepID=A0A4Y8IF80_9BACI|nr:FapA family protein [Filobacillus milosensis]TFB13680.1 DUF342 domain-containing protein [Filobacillus milosensis]
MQQFISKGKNIEEAINLGLKIMDAKKKEINIEIMQMESKGFIGIGKKPAVVKLSLNQHHNHLQEGYSSESQNYSIEKVIEHTEINENLDVRERSEASLKQVELEGKVWVENGQLFVRDSSRRYPTVTISEGITLFKDNVRVKEKSTILAEKDQIDLLVEEVANKKTDWTVNLEDQGLSAILKVNPGYDIKRQIKDIEPAEHIELTFDETKEVVNTLSEEDVVQQLKLLRINYGIDYNEIVEATKTIEPNTFIIAKGLKPHPGVNGWVEFLVEINPKNGLVEDENGKVDFRESKSIPTVEKGEIIAKIHPPKPGIPGVAVTNEPLPAQQTFPIKTTTGKGIIEVDDQLVATESGRPSIEQRGQLVKATIVPKLVHRDNVNLSSGNIRFHGDVEILGEVDDNMLVDADGDIFVHKSTSYANLTTSKSILVKGNVISSELAAGKSNMLMVELGHLLGIMHHQIEKMMVFIKQLIQSPAFKSNDFSVSGLQPLITILLEKRFKGFTTHAKKYIEVVNHGEKYLSDEWCQIAIELKQIFLTLSNHITSVDRLKHLSIKMQELSDFAQLPVEPNAYITISESNNSSLYCSGDINIIGKGCINTKVHAGGHLNVKGVVRGGEVYGRLGVTINEVGSNSGTKTIVSVPDDQMIHINKALEGTILKIGNAKYSINKEKTHVIAKLNDSEDIFLSNI